MTKKNKKTIKHFIKKFMKNQKNIEPEFAEIVSTYFWELI
jgi:hypothetical protein